MQGIRGDDHDDDSDDADNDGDDTDLFYANSHGDKGPRRGKTAAHNTVHSTAARSTAQINKMQMIKAKRKGTTGERKK